MILFFTTTIYADETKEKVKTDNETKEKVDTEKWNIWKKLTPEEKMKFEERMKKARDTALNSVKFCDKITKSATEAGCLLGAAKNVLEKKSDDKVDVLKELERIEKNMAEERRKKKKKGR